VARGPETKKASRVASDKEKNSRTGQWQMSGASLFKSGKNGLDNLSGTVGKNKNYNKPGGVLFIAGKKGRGPGKKFFKRT